MQKRQKSEFQDPTNVNNPVSNQIQNNLFNNKIGNDPKKEPVFVHSKLRNDLYEREVKTKNSFFNDPFLKKQGNSIQIWMNAQKKQNVLIKGEEYEIADINYSNQKITKPLNFEEEIKKKFISKELSEYWQKQIESKKNKNMKSKIFTEKISSNKYNENINSAKEKEDKNNLLFNQTNFKIISEENDKNNNPSVIYNFYSDIKSLPISYIKVKDLNPDSIQLFNSSFLNKLSNFSKEKLDNQNIIPLSIEVTNNSNDMKNKNKPLLEDHTIRDSKIENNFKKFYPNYDKNEKKNIYMNNKDDNQTSYNKFIPFSQKERATNLQEIQNKIHVVNILPSSNNQRIFKKFSNNEPPSKTQKSASNPRQRQRRNNLKSNTNNNKKSNQQFPILESSVEYIPVKDLKSDPQARSQTPSRIKQIPNNYFNDKFIPTNLRLDGSISNFPTIFNPYKKQLNINNLNDFIDNLNVIDKNILSSNKYLDENDEKVSENYFPFLENPQLTNESSKRRNYINYNQSSYRRRKSQSNPKSYKIFNMNNKKPYNLTNIESDIPIIDNNIQNLTEKRGTGKIIRNVLSTDTIEGNENLLNYLGEKMEKKNNNTIKVNYTFNDSYNIYTSLPNSVDV